MTSGSKWMSWVIFLAVLTAGIAGVVLYQGDRLVFAGFSLVIFTIAYLAVRFPWQYAHLFLSVAWFLGFWFKYLYHLVTGASYFELYGSFDNSSASWDAVFLVIGIGGAGYVVGRIISLQVIRPFQAALRGRETIVPLWWASRRTLVWLLAAGLVVIFVAANQEFGILTRGFVAKLILPWPFGGLFAWMTDIGLALLLSLLLAWDRQSGFGVAWGFAALCIEGALFSISTLSRGVYFFHTLPPLVTEGVGAMRSGHRRPIVILFAIWFIVGVAVPSASTFLRLFGTNTVPTTQSDLNASELAKISRPMFEHQTTSALWDQFDTMARLLLIDRWTGLEGTMATVAYPDRSMALFTEAAMQRRTYGTVDVYTHRISGSTFTEENAKTYHFATLAGPIAFFYFSGSMAVVFVGMTLIAVLMSATELLWRWLVRDRLLIAMSGLYLALVVLQLSGGLVQAATGPLTVTGVFVVVWLIGRINERHHPEAETLTQVPLCSQS